MIKKSALLGISLLAGLAMSGNSQAASEDECAIWICLPGGFPETCGAAASAMKDRIKDGKSPLPPFSACSHDGTEFGMSHNHGLAAYIPEQQVCKSWGGHQGDTCTQWDTVPEQYVKGTACQAANNDGAEMIPKGCTSTARWAEVFSNGEQQGGTYYW